MPIFPGPVRHNNEDAAILDLTKNQVVGIGVFDVIGTSEVDEARDDLHSNLRTKGYTATVRANSTTYVYTSDAYDDDSWINTNNWSIIGGSALPDGVDPNDILTYDGVSAVWENTIITKKITIKNHDVNDGVSELVFSKSDGIPYLEVLGEIRAEGFNQSGTLRFGEPSIKFVDAAPNNGSAENIGNEQKASIQFFVANEGVSEKAFEIFNDKKVAFASHTTAPTVVAGGFYYNSDEDNYYVGKNA
jgi:hypothetical protein